MTAVSLPAGPSSLAFGQKTCFLKGNTIYEFALVTRAIGIRFRWLGILLLGAAIGCHNCGDGIRSVPILNSMIQADRSSDSGGRRFGRTSPYALRSLCPRPDFRLPSPRGVIRHASPGPISLLGAWHVTVQSEGVAGKCQDCSYAAAAFGSRVDAAIAVLANDSPDILRLDDPADDAAFRSWFTFLAEAQFFRETSTLHCRRSRIAPG